jgi:ankyrin repeat protein
LKRLLLICFSVAILALVFQQESQTQTDSKTVGSTGGVATKTRLNRSTPAGGESKLNPVAEADLRAASAKAIKLIQQSQVVWSKKENCASCHHQLLPEIPIGLARERGVPVDEKVATETTNNTFAYLKDLDAAVQGYDYIDVLFDGWLLAAGRVAGLRPNLTTSASAQFIASRQLPDGSWPTVDVRPPQSNSPFTTTAVCAQAIRNFLPVQFKNEKASRLRRAGDWLLKATPLTTEDRVFQLLGLDWTGADKATLQKVARKLLGQQREDGGWSQLTSMSSDSYATGQVLAALHESGGIPVTDAGYQRGLRFLLKTQQADGSWRVGSRLHPPAPVSPPYFETGFPYQHDQFISVMGTSWAVAALLHALPVKAGEKLRQPSLEIATAEQPAWVQVALNGSVADLRKLLDGGMKPDATSAGGTTALMFAARDINKIKLLLERGANVNAQAATGINALMVASRYRGNVEAVRLLLSKGARPNAEKGAEIRNDATALFFAAMAGDVQMVAALVDAGARAGDKMKILGRFTQSPLLYATFLEKPIAEYLISKGGNPNEVDDDGISLLSWAAIANNASTVDVLLSRGAKVNLADRHGMTPLSYAASIDYGDSKVIEKLLAAGADVTAKNKEGLTALDLAKNYRHHALANLMTGKTAANSGIR